MVYDDEEPSFVSSGPAHRGACGKAVYSSERAAKAGMRKMQRWGHSRSYAGRLHPYLCRDCRAWHLGHTYRGED